jgi:two-component sensor histidine kinase
VISQREEPWGRKWEFEAESAVLRRRDVPLRPGDPGGNLLALLHDVSHLHAGELLVSARSAAVQEIHHRVKNNLQTISSLLRMQARRESSPQAVESLRTAIGRVLSVAFVHEALSREGADEVDLKALAGTLVEAALHGAQREGPDLTYTVLGPRLLLPAARASQVALILNELIQNAVKHAFPGGRTGAITIRFDASPDTITVCVRDDGVGLPGDFDLQKTTRLGLQITRRIVESDLGGELDISGDGGTTVTLRAPAALARPETEQP